MPGIFLINEFQCFVLSKVIYKNVVMVILKYLGVEVISSIILENVFSQKNILL